MSISCHSPPVITTNHQLAFYQSWPATVHDKSAAAEMGNAHDIKCTLNDEEIGFYMQSSCFTRDEVTALWYHFMTINKFSDHINLQ